MDSTFFNENPMAIAEYMDTYLKLNPPDCNFFSEDGYKLPVLKELLYQTKAMRDIVKNFDCCCNNIDIIFSTIKKNQLELMVQFLYKGEIICTDQSIATEVTSIIEKILGIPMDMNKTQQDNLIKEEMIVEQTLITEEDYEPFENSDELGIKENYSIDWSIDNESSRSVFKKPSKRKDLECLQCDKNFSSSNSLKRHKLFSCKKHDQSRKETTIFDDKSVFIEQTKTNLANSCVKCEHCNKDFNGIQNLKKHLRKTHKWTPKDMKQLKQECSFCKIDFWKQSDLQAHIVNAHQKSFECPTCGIVLKSKASLKTHIEYTHEGRKKDECHICKAELSGKANLDNHIATVHEGKKPHLCSTCGHASASKTHLKRHIDMVHEGKRPYACHVCGLTCKSKSHLNTHIRSVHEKEKLFQCKFCDRSFFDRAHLKKHQDVHDNVRPHKCHICDKTFKRKHHLGTHLKTIHEATENSKDLEKKSLNDHQILQLKVSA